MDVIRQFWQKSIRIFVLTKGTPKNQSSYFVIQGCHSSVLAGKTKCGFYRKWFLNKKNKSPSVFLGFERFASLLIFQNF